MPSSASPHHSDFRSWPGNVGDAHADVVPVGHGQEEVEEEEEEDGGRGRRQQETHGDGSLVAQGRPAARAGASRVAGWSQQRRSDATGESWMLRSLR